jgi:dipeptidyl aminopeptidase/acylaminoacyl peptidase
MRGILPGDLYNFRLIHDPSISSDGKAILFTLTQAKGENEYSSSIWKYYDGRLFPIITNLSRATSPLWSPSGKEFLFISTTLSDAKVSTQLWIADSNGLNKRKLTDFKGRSIISPKWSPDCKFVFFISDYDLDFRPEAKSDVIVVTRMNYRFDGEGYFRDKRPHIFKISLRSGKLERLTKGNFDVSSFDVSPDGKTVAFVSNTDEEADFQNNMDIYTIPSTGGFPKKLLSMKGPIANLSYSHNGKFLAYIADDYRFKFNTPLEVWVYEFKTGQISNLSRKLDRPARNSLVSDVVMDKATPLLEWGGKDESNGEVYFLATDRGTCNIYAINLASEKLRQVTSGRSVVTSFSLSRKNNAIAFVKMDPTHLPELFFMTERNSASSVAVTSFNRELLSELSLSDPSDFYFRASDGTKVHGFLFKPSSDLRESSSKKKLPCVVEIHGGGGAVGFQFMHEFQCLVAQGFAVLTCNFRGTQGYGSKFMKVLTGHYMEKDYSDIIDMINHAIEKGWVNREKLGITGGSYGGYLTNWIVSHSKMFAAAVTDRSVVNLYSFYGTSDDYRLIEEDVMVSFPWDRPDRYLAKSPIAYTKNITTPLLIMHSERDFRCRLEQAEQFYAFLRRQDKKVQFIIFPDESHGLSRAGKPHHRVERLQFMLWWLTSHIRTGKQMVAPPV